MLFPIGDDDSQISGPCVITYGLILANLAVFFLLQQAGSNAAFTYGWSVIPAEIISGVDLVRPQQILTPEGLVSIPQAPGPVPIYLTVLSAMFMHGGYVHLFGNLLYLWIFGDNVEHRFGSVPFLLFYLVSGGLATMVQILIDPDGVVPNLGASGAISGVLGAYLVLFPRNRVHALFFIFVVTVPAVVAIGLWIFFQFINGFGAIMVYEGGSGGVAYGAHIGGFFAGVALAIVLRGVIKKEPPNIYMTAPQTYRPYRYR